MNKIHRTVWSAARQTFVVAHEKAATHGKPSSMRKGVASAVAAGLLTLGAGQAMAAGPCPAPVSDLITIDGTTVDQQCALGADDSLTISDTGGISINGQTNPVIVNSGTTAGSITNSGTISNTETGQSVDNDAVAVFGQVIDVINHNLIQSDTGTGVSINDGGVARNIINSGIIESSDIDSVSVNSSSMTGGITNSGTASKMIGGLNGVFVNSSTIDIGIENHGTIEGSGTSSTSAGIALFSSNIAGGIVNSGTLSVIRGANGIYLGGATNAYTSSGASPNISSVGGAIQNSGLVEGTDGAGVLLNGARLGSIVNDTDATISGGNSGIKLSSRNWTYYTSSTATTGSGVFKSTITGGITNRGLITGGTSSANHVYGLYMDGNSTIGGSIINEGTIAGLGSDEVAGIALFSASRIATGITNSGLISGSASSGVAHGISLKSGSTIGGIVNEGRIEGLGGSTSQGVGIGMAASTISGSIVNYGTIEGAAGSMGVGIGLNTSSITGGITNSGALSSIVGSIYGINLQGSSIGGNIVNIGGGRIEGQSGAGIVLYNSTMTGGITNSGTLSSIVGSTYGISLTSSTIGGSIVNQGTISATSGTGISIYSSSRVDSGITNTGTILGEDGDGLGIYYGGTSTPAGQGVTITGGITNSGLIKGSGGTGDNGIDIDDGTMIDGNIVNLAGGTISGQGTGLEIDESSIITGAIINHGRIESSQRTGIQIQASSVVEGGITNTGAIVGLQHGLRIYDSSSTITGGITNSGLISGGAGYNGIDIDDGSYIDGDIANLAGGTISGGSTGIALHASSSITGSINNAGLIVGGDKSLSLGSAQAFTVNNTGTLQGDVYLGSAGSILNLNGNTARVIGNVANAGLSSTVNVNGTFTSEGTFDIGLFNVNSGGLFNMNHDITADTTTVNSGGTLNVGSATRNVTGAFPGTGNYVQTGTLRLSLTDPVSAYGKLAVSGTADVAGGVDVVINGSPNIASGTTVAGIITSTDGMTVTPANLAVTDNHLFYDFTAATVSDPGFALDLLVAVDPNPLTDAAKQFKNPAALGVAGALESMFLNGIPAPMQPVFDTLVAMTPEQANAAMSQMLPLLTGGATVAMGNAMHGLNRIVQARQEGQHGRSTGDEFYGDGHFWMKPFGSWADQDDRKGVSGFDADTYGMVFGADAALSDADRLGFALAYARSDVDSNSNVAPNSADVDTYQAVVYGSRALSQATEVHFQADVGFHKTDGERSVNLLLPGQVADSDFDSWSFHIGAGLAHTLSLSDKTSITPSVRADYARIDSESYDEKGAGALNLEVNDATFEELILSVDAKLAHRLTDRATLTANMGVGYDAINEDAAMTSAFAGAPGTAFATRGLEPDAWSYRGGLGVVGNVTEALEVTARYDFELKEDFDNQTASVKFRWAF